MDDATRRDGAVITTRRAAHTSAAEARLVASMASMAFEQQSMLGNPKVLKIKNTKNQAFVHHLKALKAKQSKVI